MIKSTKHGLQAGREPPSPPWYARWLPPPSPQYGMQDGRINPSPNEHGMQEGGTHPSERVYSSREMEFLLLKIH